MPTYPYVCKDCKQNWKVFHAMDEKETKCSFCSSENIEKTFTTVLEYVKSRTSLEDKEQIKNRVEKHIEEAREALKEQLKETRRDYKP